MKIKPIDMSMRLLGEEPGGWLPKALFLRVKSPLTLLSVGMAGVLPNIISAGHEVGIVPYGGSNDLDCLFCVNYSLFLYFGIVCGVFL